MTRPAHALAATATARATAQETRVSPVVKLSTSPASTAPARARPAPHIRRSGRIFICGLRESVDDDVSAVVDAGHAGDRVELGEVGARQGSRAAGAGFLEDAAVRRLEP